MRRMVSADSCARSGRLSGTRYSSGEWIAPPTAPIVSTTGNEDCHVILRGGKTPNYDAQHVDAAAREIAAAALAARLMVDLSHANSNKDFKRQTVVAKEMARAGA